MKSHKKIQSQPGLSTSQSEKQIQFYKKGFLNLTFQNKDSLNNLINFLNDEVVQFNNGNRKYWKQTFGGAFDMVNDDIFIDFIQQNNLIDIINSITNQEYVLGDAKFRMWTPGDGYLKWHRDTYIENNGKIIGKIPPDINIFYYPRLNYKKSPQLHLIERSHRQEFNNIFLNKIQITLGKRLTIMNDDNNFIMFNSSIIHGLPKYKKYLPTRLQRIVNNFIDSRFQKKCFYPRLILRFCAYKNRKIYNRGTDYNDNKLKSFNLN